MKVISILNPKGGAGKTISSVNIAYALIRKGKKVLLIDTDPRSAIEIYLNIENEKTLNELIKEYYENNKIKNFSDYIIKKNDLDIIISSPLISKIDTFFEIEYDDKQAIFHSIIDLLDLFINYDYVIFDTEGTINNLNTAILNATDYIFVPSKSSNIDLNGIPDIVNTYEKAKKRNKKLKIKKVFLVDVSERTNSFKDAKKDFEDYFKNTGINFSDTYIRHDQNIVNSMKKTIDIFNYKNTSNSAIDYRNLIDEFLEGER